MEGWVQVFAGRFTDKSYLITNVLNECASVVHEVFFMDLVLVTSLSLNLLSYLTAVVY